MDYRLSSLDGKPDVGTNTVIANDVSMRESTVLFRGENNLLFVEEGAELRNVQIRFMGNNSVVFISKTAYKCPFVVNIYHDSTFYMGKNNSINGQPAIFQLSEHKNIFIGDDNMFSLNTVIRLADPHLIYSTETFERINDSKSVYIGDHVWIGQDVNILKGVKVGSGSIIAGQANLTKSVPSNTTFGGNPAKLIKTGIFWLRPSVHPFDQAATEKWATFERETFVYSDEKKMPFELIEQKLETLKDPVERMDFLKNMPKDKNRFYRALDTPKSDEKQWKSSFLRRLFSK